MPTTDRRSLDNGSSTETTRPLLEVAHLRLAFGGVVALDDLSFDVEQGTICGLIGPNGAGKTTLFNVLSRLYPAGRGEVTFAGESLLALRPNEVVGRGIGRTFQNIALFPALTVTENVMVGGHTTVRTGYPGSMLRTRRCRRAERELRGRAVETLAVLDLVGVADHPAQGLPFGTLKRVELARALASSPQLLLLDEPASGLTRSEVDELAALIRDLRDRYDLTVLLVEHHMGMVMGISDLVVAMEFGHKIAQGTPRQVQTHPAVVDAYLGNGR